MQGQGGAVLVMKRGPGLCRFCFTRNSASTLSRRYGGWLRAIKAAAWLAAGGAGRAPFVRVFEPQRPYARDEVLVALERCRRAVGRWPGPAEYEEWVRLRGHLQRRFVSAERTPGHAAIVRLFGGIDKAAQGARGVS
jgi:hypothetical protein